MKKNKPIKRLNHHMVRWADKFELAKTRTDKHLNPHLYREPFWHGDGSPAVRVTLTWSKRSAQSPQSGREEKPCPSDVSLADHLDNEADGAQKAADENEIQGEHGPGA